MGGARVPAEMQKIPGRGLEAAGDADHEGFVRDPGFHQRIGSEVLDGDDPGRRPMVPNLHVFGAHAKSEPLDGSWVRHGRGERAVCLRERACGHDDHLVGQRHRFDLVVGDIDHGDAQPALQRPDLPAHVAAQLRGEVGQRLVHQTNRRLADDRAPERDALLLAAGKLRRLALEQLVEPENAGRAGQPRVPLGPRHLAHLQPEQDVLGDGEVRKQRVGLEHHGHPAPRRRQPGDVAARDGHRAGIRSFEPGDDAQRRRLSASGRPEQHGQTARLGREAHAFDRRVGTPGLADFRQSDFGEFPHPGIPMLERPAAAINGWKVRAVEGGRDSRWLARLRRPAETEELPTVHPRCYILPSQWPAIQERDREGTMPGPRGTLVRYSIRLARGVIASALLVAIIQGCGDAAAQERNIIIFVWDGLRPDSINPTDTPNLHALREAGVEFTDNHSTYPTFTMMNAASFATGGFPGSTGYYGNTVWQPGAQGPDSANVKVDFQQPVFTEDYAILDDLTRFLKGDLLLIDTLFEAAQQAGMVTAAVGKTGAAFLQDYKRGGLLLDEKTALPLSFAKELQAAGIPLPATAAKTYAPDELTLAPNNGNPIEFKAPKRLKDGVTFDPTDSSGSPYTAGLQYMADVYIDYILPKKSPRLSMLWIRDPDTSQHVYGVGSPNARDALRSTDAMLGQLRARLKQIGEEATTDIIVVSDHGHSNVAGSSQLFPLRAIADGAVAAVDPGGYSVSGLVRLADLMHRAGFTVFDGIGCTYLPVALGIKADGTPVYPVETDRDGKLCGKEGQKYNIGPYKVPASLPPNALVIAVNGGSDYIYAPDRDAATVRKAVEFLQTRSEIGAIFVDSRYGALPGTLPLNLIRVENTAGRNPDVIVSYDYDASAVIGGANGTEYSGSLLNNSYRGMHGSFSPLDVHNTLIAYGPDFREGLKDPLPTGNVDVAPTVAGILGLSLPRADGRPLLEALRNGPGAGDYQVVSRTLRPNSVAIGISVKLPTDPGGREIDPDKKEYTIELETKSLTYQGRTYTYFDSAKAVRQ